MKNEIKKWTSVKLLDWSFTLMPNCLFKIKLAQLINDSLLIDLDKPVNCDSLNQTINNTNHEK